MRLLEGMNRAESSSNYRNPASPDVLISPHPWEGSRTTTPTASSSLPQVNDDAQGTSLNPRLPLPTISSQPPGSPNSPPRVRSTGDILSENETSMGRVRPANAVVSETLYHEKDKEFTQASVPDQPLELTEPKEDKEKDKES